MTEIIAAIILAAGALIYGGSALAFGWGTWLVLRLAHKRLERWVAR